MLLNETSCLFVEHPEVTNSIDIHFYYQNHDKLHKIFSSDKHVNFLFHYIYFNIKHYTEIRHVIQHIYNEIGKNICQEMNINDNSIHEAHRLLVKYGIVEKHICVVDFMYCYDNEKPPINIKNQWFFRNNKFNRNIIGLLNVYTLPYDYIKQILKYKLTSVL